MKRLAGLVLVALVLTACAHVDPAADRKVEGSGTPTPAPSSSPSPTSTPSSSRAVSARPKVIGTVADHLEVPWGIAFLPDGSALVTERDSGKVLQITGRRVTTVGTIDEAKSQGEGGLLGVAVSPSYSEDGRVFFYAST